MNFRHIQHSLKVYDVFLGQLVNATKNKVNKTKKNNERVSPMLLKKREKIKLKFAKHEQTRLQKSKRHIDDLADLYI